MKLSSDASVELLCRERTLDPDVTLELISRELWQSSSNDLVLHYRVHSYAADAAVKVEAEQ